MKTLASILVLLSSVSFAQTATTEEPTLGEKAKATAQRAEVAVQAAVSNAGDRRRDATVSLMIEYSPLDLILPSKFGGAVGYLRSRRDTFELEVLGSSLSAPFFIKDVGGFEDRRVSLIYRSYAERNSFNFHAGLSYFDTGIHVGSKFLQSATNLSAYSDLLRARSLGLMIGFGNRWVFPHGLSLGVDWIEWSQPLVVLDEESSVINAIHDEGAKQTLEDTFHLAMFFPRFALLKIAAGWTF